MALRHHIIDELIDIIDTRDVRDTHLRLEAGFRWIARRRRVAEGRHEGGYEMHYELQGAIEADLKRLAAAKETVVDFDQFRAARGKRQQPIKPARRQKALAAQADFGF